LIVINYVYILNSMPNLPKFKFNLAGKLVPALVVVVVLMAFALGAMWGKLQGLSGTKIVPTAGSAPAAAGNTVPAAPSKYASFDDAMQKLADSAGLDGKKLVTCMNSGEKQAAVTADANEGTGLGVNGTPAFFINGRLLAGALPYPEFKKVIDDELSGHPDKTATRVKVSLGNAPTRGQSGAPVTIVEYSDFQCPFCGQAFPTVQQVLKDYGGKVLFAYKQFPLASIHPHAEKAAEASECAKDQGKFWEFHDKLFQTQQDWAST